MELLDTPSKHNRTLALCLRLLNGEIINKAEEARRYAVNERSIQRDLDDLRAFFANRAMYYGENMEIIYDHRLKGYRLIFPQNHQLSNGEALAVCKILLECRGLQKEELETILTKIISGCVPSHNQPQIKELIANERHCYIAPRHGRLTIDMLWEIGCAVKEQRLMMIEYTKLKNNATVQRIIKPVGIMFSEYYFYLTAFIDNIDKDAEFENKDDLFPTIYRLDRIAQYRILEEHYAAPYKNRFQEGEFRKRIQFMYGGKLQTIKFQYTGPSIEAVLDRLPTAQATKQPDGSFLVSAEVFGKGIDMWIRSQGEYVKLLSN